MISENGKESEKKTSVYLRQERLVKRTKDTKALMRDKMRLFVSHFVDRCVVLYFS